MQHGIVDEIPDDDIAGVMPADGTLAVRADRQLVDAAILAGRSQA